MKTPFWLCLLLALTLGCLFVAACLPNASSSSGKSAIDDDDDAAPADDDDDNDDDASPVDDDDDDDASPAVDDDDDNDASPGDDDDNDNDDDDLAWTEMWSGTGGSLTSVWAVAADDVFAVGTSGVPQYNGFAMHYAGATWSSTNFPTPVLWPSVWADSPSDAYVADLGGIYQFDGQSWNSVYDPAQQLYTFEWLFGVWGASANNVFVTGFYEIIMEGVSWGEVLMGSGTTWDTGYLGSTLFGVGGTSDSDVFAVGVVAGATTFHFDGASWDSGVSLGEGLPAAVWSATPSDAFVVGCGGNTCTATFLPSGGVSAVWRYNGSTWSSMTVPNGPTLSSVWGSSASDVFAVGADPSVNLPASLIHYDGSTWQPMAFPSSVVALAGVSGTAPNDVFAVGSTATGPVILHYGAKR
jgi:hypothetical protein